jgi:hypothetical protein
VRPVHGQRRLADARGPGDRGDHHGGGGCAGGQRVQLGERPGPADEGPHRRRKLGRHDGRGAAGGRRVVVGGRLAGLAPQQVGGVGAGEDGPFQALQAGARLDPELLDEDPADLLVRRQRVGLPAGAVQGQDQPGPERLAQRVGADQGLQLTGQVGGAAQPQVDVGPALQQDQGPFLQPGRLGRAGRPGDTGQHRPAPERECLGQQRRAVLQPRTGTGLDRLGGRHVQLVHPVEVQLTLAHLEQVAGVPGQQRLPGVVGTQRPAEVGDAAVQQTARRGGRVLAPELLDQPVDGDHPVRVEQQRGQQRALLRTTEGDPQRSPPDLQRTEHAVPHDRTVTDGTRRAGLPDATYTKVSPTPGGRRIDRRPRGAGRPVPAPVRSRRWPPRGRPSWCCSGWSPPRTPRPCPGR